jgi:uncharacterized protein (DUF433 family)
MHGVVTPCHLCDAARVAGPSRHVQDDDARMIDPMTSTLLGVGIYSVPEASRLTRISTYRLRRWLRGYIYTTSSGRHAMPHVIHGELPAFDGALALSFLDLQEARCLDEFRKRGVGWRTLRDVHERACERLNIHHPFSTGQFKTVGRDVVHEYAEQAGDRRLLDMSLNQEMFHSVLEPYLRGLEFSGDSEFPNRWFPFEETPRVMLDPEHGFGRPVVTRFGVATDVLARAYRAEGTYDKVARWYDVDVASVEQAVAYEQYLAAA